MDIERIDGQWHLLNGTSLHGYVESTYAELVEVFGEPTDESGDGKTDVEWHVRIGGTVCTIYNYKTGKAYLGSEGKDVEDMTTWHVGGRDSDCVERVRKVLDA